MTGLTGMFSNRYTFDDIPDQRGKTAIVTGGSAGIGANIALGLALAGAKVHIVSTTPEHGEETVEAINSAVQKASTASPKFASGHAQYHQLDLGDLNAVNAFGNKIAGELKVGKSKLEVEKGLGNPNKEDGAVENTGGLDYLINNAGIGVAAYSKTKDGLACHFGVNHLSHMLLTHTLLPLLNETASLPDRQKGDVRVVMQASVQHKLTPPGIKFESVKELNEDIGGNGNYARSKLMNILYTKELARRKLAPEGNQILGISVHPGAVATDQEKAAQEPYGLLGTALVAASRVFFMSPEQGSESALWATTSPKPSEDPAKYQGVYLSQPDDSIGNETDQAKDMELARRLWEISRQVIKEKTGVEIDY